MQPSLSTKDCSARNAQSVGCTSERLDTEVTCAIPSVGCSSMRLEMDETSDMGLLAAASGASITEKVVLACENSTGKEDSNVAVVVASLSRAIAGVGVLT